MEKPLHLETADEIARQLGGCGKLNLLTGANSFLAHNEARGALSFKLPKTAAGMPNYVKITLEDSDTYTIYTCRIRAGRVTNQKKETDIYAEDLIKYLEKETGLYFTLFSASENEKLAAIMGGR